MAVLNSADLLNLLSTVASTQDLFGTKQEALALQAMPVVQNASPAVNIVANVFTVGAVISVLELPQAERAEGVEILKARLDKLVPFLEKAITNEASLHAQVYEFMNTVNPLPFAVGALYCLQAKLERYATQNTDDKAIISEFFGCAFPEYTTSDLIIAMLDEIQRNQFISENDWTDQPYMPLDELKAA